MKNEKVLNLVSVNRAIVVPIKSINTTESG